MTFFLIPYDGGNLKVKGSSRAPSVIVEDYFKEFNCSDNRFLIPINNFNMEETSDNIVSFIEKDNPNFFFPFVFLGGDHSITYSTVRALIKNNFVKDLLLIYFDAHMDAEDSFIPPSHEDTINALVSQKLVDSKNLILVGVRKYWDKEISFIKENKIKTLEGKDISEISKELFHFISKNSEKKIYLSFDVDFFDNFTSTGYPEKDGYSYDDLIKILSPSMDLIKKNLISFDVVEYMPDLDKEKKDLLKIRNFIKFLKQV